MNDLADMKAIGLAHHRAGRLAQAEACYRAILANDPANPTALHLLGVLAHQMGQPQSAVELISRAIALNDRLPELHCNLGNALHELGRLHEAETSFRRALALKDDHAAAHNNLGVVLMEQGFPQEAEACYRSAATLLPDHPDAHSNLGSALCAQGHAVDAEICCRRAIALAGDHAFAHNNLGNALKDQGRLEEAQACYQRAIALAPNFAEPRNNLGLTLEQRGRLAEAEGCYRRALELKPDYSEARVNLANLRLDRDDLAEALIIARQGLKIRETIELKALFSRCLRSAGANLLGPTDLGLRRYLMRALSEPWGRPADLAAYAASVLKQGPIGESIRRASAPLPLFPCAPELPSSADLTVAVEDLLLCLLESTSVCDLELERFLTAVRRALLEAAAERPDSNPINDAVLKLACALARQCFINEYIFAVAEREAGEVARVRATVAARLASGDTLPALLVAVLGAYLPLGSVANATLLLDRTWPKALNEVLTQQLRQPIAEKAERDAIARLTPITDEVSRRVQKQYEENPYPRWVRVAVMARPSTVDAFLCRQLPWAAPRRLGKPEAVDILIAGCGTGQHAIETAQRFPTARILAIDLSLASLAYAQRQSRALGLSHLRYAQADILQLPALGESFDLIEAIGVLHHLADPLGGWRALLAILRSGGIMRLGLYSALARSEIAAVHRFIAERGYRRSADAVRKFRQDLLRSEPAIALKLAAECRDFFSLSECRDLLFHAQEHRFTVPQIKSFLTEHGLAFLGFEIEGAVLQRFRGRFSGGGALTDLDRWHDFEIENPRTFIGMYQFYVQKP